MARPGVLIVGVSTRALAESACRAGWRCASVDAFGDLDQKARVDNIALTRAVALTAARSGAELVVGQPVQGLLVEGERVTGALVGGKPMRGRTARSCTMRSSPKR